MNFRRVFLFLCTFGLLLVVAAAPALASEQGGEDPLDSTTGLVFRLLNFSIVAVGLLYAFGKLLPKVFRARAESISAAISEAARARQEAEQRLREAEKRLDRLDLEIGVLKENAQRDAAAEAERIRAAAREEVAKIERASELEILAAERSARMELKAQAAQLAVERAERMLRDTITPGAESALFRMFLSDLGRSAN